MGKTIGIDFGTSKIRASFFDGERVRVIEDASIPNVVACTADGERIVGQQAVNQAVTNPGLTAFSLRRLLGREKTLTLSERVYTPQELAATVLLKIRKTAETILHDEVSDAVVTVPAMADISQRLALMDACKIAGLRVRRLIHESSAAAIVFGHANIKRDTGLVVVSFGAGNFEVSVMEIGGGVYEVKSVVGDTDLGGDDIDDMIVGWLSQDFMETENIDLTKDPAALRRMKEAVEKAKIELADYDSSRIYIPYISTTSFGAKHLDKSLTRTKFQELIAPVLRKIRQYCEQALSKAELEAPIEHILLVGSSSRIPVVRDTILETVSDRSVNNKGRAVHNINIEGAAVLGAGLYAGVIEGKVGDVLLLEALSRSLGIETNGDSMTKMITAGSTVPSKCIETFTTSVDNQTSLSVNVFQGENKKASLNRLIGKYTIEGLPAAKRGIQQINVSFLADCDGLLEVSVTDKSSGKVYPLKVTGDGRLSEDEIIRMRNALFGGKIENPRPSKPDVLPTTNPKRSRFDVFISYSRKDFDEVSAFVEMLKRRVPGIRCWFDITGIESGDEFEDKIISAIDGSEYVLFALSDNSINSMWTKDEVSYAKNTDKKIIPIILRGGSLKGWFLFKFGRIDCISIDNQLQIEKLIRNLSEWTDA